MTRSAPRIIVLALLSLLALLGPPAEAQRKRPPPPPADPPPPPLTRRRAPPPSSPPPNFPFPPTSPPRTPPPTPPPTPPSPPPPPPPRSPAPSPVAASRPPPSPPPQAPPPKPPVPPATQPNFVIIMTDDQDYLLNSTHPAYMPKLHRHIATQGLHLNQFIVTSSLCCPSRVSLLTGRFTHNHNVTSNQAPQGGWGKFKSLQMDSSWLPLWLKPLGYNTYFTGKFINLFDVPAGDTRNCPKGWDVFDPLTDKTVYDYINFDFTPQCARTDSFRNAYQTDVINDRAMRYIDDAVSKAAPFYLQINPAACHTACPKGAEEGGSCVPPVPSPKYAGRFTGVKTPKLSNWGVRLSNKLDIGPAGTLAAEEAGIDRHYQRRLESLLSVDDLIESVVTRLEQRGVLNNTYIVYVSDNGYHLGNHNIPKGKTLPYEEDVRVPFYIRGPGIPAGVIHPYMATMVDLTSTFVALGGGSPPDNLDGIPLPLERIARESRAAPAATPLLPNSRLPPANGTLRQMLPVEMWINSLSKDLDKKDYRSVRICTNYTLSPNSTANPGFQPSTANRTTTVNETCWKYTVWCIWPTPMTVIHKELFDLGVDPGEVNNLWETLDSNPNLNYKRLEARLDALLQVMGYCRGESCRRPWARLHPEGGVDSLEAAMDPRYDAKYDAYTKFSWRSCQQYYDPVNNEVADRALGGVSRWVAG